LGILGNAAPLGSDLNLLFHIGIFVLVLTGFTFARRKKYDNHEKLMLSAIGLVAISFFVWMAPSYFRYFNLVMSDFYTLGIMITNIHVILGITTSILAVYIVARMKLYLPERFRVKRVKRLMRTTLGLWILTFSFGVLFYVCYVAR
jgi:uncharacterized membrane protein YozB (DUF420 family)